MASSVRQGTGRRPLGVEIDGPFFTADLAKTVDANVHDLLTEMAKAGEAMAQGLAAGAPRKTAGPSWSASLIRGRVVSLRSKQWHTTAVVSVDTTGLSKEQAVSAQARMAGRRKAIGTRRESRLGGLVYRETSYALGTMPGHEGTAGVFSKTAAGLRRLVKKLDLTKGLG